MIGVLKEIKVIRPRVMEATVLRKIFFKERTSGRRPVDEDSAKCVVWGKPGEELPRQREQQVQKLGFCEQGRVVGIMQGLSLGLRSLWSQWRT